MNDNEVGHLSILFICPRCGAHATVIIRDDFTAVIYQCYRCHWPYRIWIHYEAEGTYI